MRQLRQFVLSLLLTGPSLVACDERSANLIVAPQANLNGATVQQFTTTAFSLIYDAESQLLAAHAPSNICSGGSLNQVDVLRVFTPSAIGQRFAQQQADEQVAVYHATSPAEAGLSAPISFFGFGNIVNFGQFCAFLSGPNLIAEGTAQRISTFTLASFHGRWTGTLAGVDGRNYRLVETYQLNADIHDPNNPATFTEPVVRILLEPLP